MTTPARPDGSADARPAVRGTPPLAIHRSGRPRRLGAAGIGGIGAPGRVVVEIALETMAAARIEREDALAAWPWPDRDGRDPDAGRGPDDGDPPPDRPHRPADDRFRDISGRSAVQSGPENADPPSDPSSGARAPQAERVFRQHSCGPARRARSNGMTGLAA